MNSFKNFLIFCDKNSKFFILFEDMNQWLAIDEYESPIKRQMARAFRGCRCAALLLVLTLLLLIGGTLLTILPTDPPNYHRLDQQTPLQTMGLVFLILGCMCAAAEVVLVVITIVFLRSVKTLNRNEILNSNETDLFRPSLNIQNINNYNNNNTNDYKNFDFSAIQYSCPESPNSLATKQSLSTVADIPSKECHLLELNL